MTTPDYVKFTFATNTLKAIALCKMLRLLEKRSIQPAVTDAAAPLVMFPSLIATSV